ncbi:hypothetical protein I3A86_24940, partial [Salmonella enterica]|nr:hypothetical protein [Salmonella enterica]
MPDKREDEARWEAKVAILCLGALLTGLVAGPLIPILPFACAVMVAVALGSSWAIVKGVATEQAALSSLAMLVASQIGYGLGLVLVALATRG